VTEGQAANYTHRREFIPKKPGATGKGWTVAAKNLTNAQDCHIVVFFQRTSHTLTFTLVFVCLVLLEYTCHKMRGLAGLLTIESEKLITQ